MGPLERFYKTQREPTRQIALELGYCLLRSILYGRHLCYIVGLALFFPECLPLQEKDIRAPHLSFLLDHLPISPRTARSAFLRLQRDL